MITISHSDEGRHFRLSIDENTHDVMYEAPRFKITAKGSADTVYRTIKGLPLPKELAEVLEMIYA